MQLLAPLKDLERQLFLSLTILIDCVLKQEHLPSAKRLIKRRRQSLLSAAVAVATREARWRIPAGAFCGSRGKKASSRWFVCRAVRRRPGGREGGREDAGNPQRRHTISQPAGSERRADWHAAVSRASRRPRCSLLGLAEPLHLLLDLLRHHSPPFVLSPLAPSTPPFSLISPFGALWKSRRSCITYIGCVCWLAMRRHSVIRRHECVCLIGAMKHRCSKFGASFCRGIFFPSFSLR